MTTVHVVGAGLAGLSASVRLAQSGVRVCLYEAAPRAGGRCRSFLEPQLDCTVDNGSHVILGANDATLSYIDAVGSRDELLEIAPAAFPFLDVKTRESWSLRPNRGPVPWWIFAPSRRAAGTRAPDYLRLATLLTAGPDKTVAQCVTPDSAIFRRFVDPLATAVMNTPPGRAAARPLARVLRQTLLRGERACRPAIARRGLSRALVDPALAFLARTGASFRANARIERVELGAGRIEALVVAGESIRMGPQDAVVLATPAWVTAGLVPGVTHPAEHCAIVNAHFRLTSPVRLPGGIPLLALIGATAQWLIARDDVVSITVSAADHLIDRPADDLLECLWQDAAAALGLAGPMPPARLIKEKRSTFSQTPAAEKLRPAAATAWSNMALAGDWTATGLPATIEGAIRSGNLAAEVVARPIGRIQP